MPCTGTIRKRAPQLLDRLSDEEKTKEFELHDTIHEVMRELFPKSLDIHKNLNAMSPAELAKVWAVVLKRFRAKIAAKKSASKYLRLQGQKDKADKLDAEIAQAEAEADAHHDQQQHEEEVAA